MIKMGDIKEKIKKELDELIDEGYGILESGEQIDVINVEYQSWYTRTLSVVKQLIPERYQEFQEQYKSGKRRDTISSYFLEDLRTFDLDEQQSIFEKRLTYQIAILASARDKIDSILADIKGVLQYELFDNELEAAKELLKNGYLRPAGALASVTLETHLSKLIKNHNLKITKSRPSIADYNSELKKNGIYDLSKFQFILWLGSIRKLCVHKKEREPTKDEVRKLIEGVREIIKTTS